MVKRVGKAKQRKLRADRLRNLKRRKIISDLNCDKQFLIAKEKIWCRLNAALHSPDTKSDVVRFFQVFPGCSVGLVPLIREFLGSLRDKGLGNLLWDYVRFSLRYSADFELRRPGSKGRFNFAIVYPEPKADSFRAKLVHQEFEPFSESRWRGARIANFEIPVEEVPKYCQEQVIQGEARYFRIDDRWLESVLTNIESLAYDSNKVVFIEHRAEIPYLHLLIGGTVSKKILRNAQKAITKFQLTRMGSKLAGAKLSTDTLEQLKRVLVALRGKAISGKEIALEKLPGLKFQSALNFVSNTKNFLKK